MVNILEKATPGKGGLALLFIPVGVLQYSQIQLFHLKHGLCDAAYPGRVGIKYHVVQLGWDYLPRHAKPVLEPSTGLFQLLASLSKPFPVIVYLILGVAVDNKRDRFVELK